MTSSKSTKRALLTSVLAILMCATMLIGTTFAWFTDSASTGINKIQSGNLDIVVEHYVDGVWVPIDGATDLFRNVNGQPMLWEPGAASQELFRVSNEGSLALKYQFMMNYTNATETTDGKTLADALSVQVVTGVGTFNTPNLESRPGIYEGLLFDVNAPENGAPLQNFTYSEHLLPGEIREFYVTIGWTPTENDNDFNVAGGLSIDLGISVVATQYTYEYDGDDNQYDADAQLPSVWDGNTVEVPEEINNVYHITSAAEFAWMMEQTNQANNSWHFGDTFVLDCDIDFGGQTITGVGSDNDNIDFTFDGNGHTIRNFKIDNGREWYAGLFNQLNGIVKNLTVENATVIGDRMVGVIASNVDGGAIENCHVKDSVVISRMKKAGAVTGYVANGSVTGCTATDVNVYCADPDQAESGKLVGYINAGSTVDEVTETNAVRVNVYANTKFVSTAAELAAALADPTNGGEQPARTVVITKDLDMSGWASVEALTNYPSVTIEGMGHTLKNLSAPLFKNVPGRFYNFNNITVHGANIHTGSNGYGAAFIGEFQNNAGGKISFVNCHVNNADISAYKYAGAFVGYAANGGAIEITDCSVCDVTINTEDSSCGAFVGHTRTETTITNGKIFGNTNVGCAQDRNGSPAKAGWFIGTIQGVTTIRDCSVNSNGELSNNDSAAPIAGGFIGRNEGGSLN